ARAARGGKRAEQRERCRVRLDHALDIPLLIEFRETAGDLGAVRGKIEQVALDLVVDAAIDAGVGIAAHAAPRGGNHVRRCHVRVLAVTPSMTAARNGSGDEGPRLRRLRLTKAFRSRYNRGGSTRRPA